MFILGCKTRYDSYSFTATSHIVIPFGLSMAIFIGVTMVGFPCIIFNKIVIDI